MVSTFPQTVSRFCFGSKGVNKGYRIFKVNAETKSGWFFGYVLEKGPDSFAYRPAHEGPWTEGATTREEAAWALYDLGKARGAEREKGMAFRGQKC